MDEWRKAARVGVVSEVQIQRIASETGEVVAWGTDLSEGGIGLLLNDSLQVGDETPPSAGHSWIKVGEEVALQIATPGSDAPISVKGLVVWAKAAKPGLRVGVRFREVGALSGAQILQLVTERLAQLSPATIARVEEAARQPASLPATPAGQAGPLPPPATPAKPIRVRRPLLAILLAVVALALLLQNMELRRSVQNLKATGAALQTE